ncbi:transporter substrate-binding domain-containing protein [Fusobacterium sp. MFO224]|uniref:transporter substrate-binding domain-containing protein n=1 Tax=Fusobacterium sp. MFO224 TaxID=3378070 RepID=UPI0038529D05
MKKKILFLIILTTLGLVSCNSKNKEKPLVVAMELAYPPFEMKDSTGTPSGISVDFAKDFGKYINKEIKIENIAWEGLIPSIQTGKADLVISSMSITNERKKIVDFSIPYSNSLQGILTNKNSNVKNFEELDKQGNTIAVKTGSTGFIFAMKNVKNAKVIALADESACVTEVVQGKADGFFYDQLTIYRNWKKHKDTTTPVFIPYQDIDVWGVAVKKGNTELLNKLNEFIIKYRKEGGFDNLSTKYLSKEKKDFDALGFKWFFDLED